MFEPVTPRARTVITAAAEEARQRGDRRVGTEHLLLAVLRDAETARAVGVDATAARRALDALDLSALDAVGVDAHGIERHAVPLSRKHTPLTSGARAVLPRALREAKREGTRRLTVRHLTLALLACDPPDPAATLLAQLAVDRPAVRTRLTGGS